uniref:Uncharacterized protein n=1 Tax=Neogobius melanostomus TaxID=47308 RepID=A0A8C6WSC0_9GOBI
MLSALQTEDHEIVCGGDGRADSPGHCAKYGTYTMMELRKKAVIDIQTVQSNEVGGSYHMEGEGLARSLQRIKNFVAVDTLITDRHVSIKKYLREQVTFYYNETRLTCMLFISGLKKKLQAAAQLKGCNALKGWVASIVNHLYWSVVSSPPHERELVLDKFQSVVYHIQNQHQGFPGRFTRCLHGPLQGQELQKAWLQPSAMEMERIVCNPRLLKDICQLSSSYQTSTIEAFHSLLNHFAPKMISFSFNGMECRTTLAALHFNQNAHRAQSVTEDGAPVYGLHYPKMKSFIMSDEGLVVRNVTAWCEYTLKVFGNTLSESCDGPGYTWHCLEFSAEPSPAPDSKHSHPL